MQFSHNRRGALGVTAGLGSSGVRRKGLGVGEVGEGDGSEDGDRDEGEEEEGGDEVRDPAHVAPRGPQGFRRGKGRLPSKMTHRNFKKISRGKIKIRVLCGIARKANFLNIIRTSHEDEIALCSQRHHTTSETMSVPKAFWTGIFAFY